MSMPPTPSPTPPDRPDVPDSSDSIAPRKSPRKTREYRWVEKGLQAQLPRLLTVALLCVAVFSASQIIGYLVQLHNSRQTSAALRELYYAESDADSAEQTAAISAATAPTDTPAPTATPSPTLKAALDTGALPDATPRTRLEAVPYPGNPYRITQSRFIKLQRQNSDIIGWLTIDGLLDEAVVHRDNEYYLRRDYRGYHNDNGAVFLEETCDLKTRPYTYMLYAHNMKSGAMFGCLRNYENKTFYESNPFITFDTAYEDGRYVIFAISTIKTDTTRWGFVDFSRLCSPRIEWREAEIASLRTQSMYANGIDVTADDQLLLLITCTGESIERRVVAARRIRPDETEEQLLKLVQHTRRQ